MSLLVVAEPAPLTPDKHGVVRIASTRVTLETVITAFHEGATAEAIVQQYPSLDLADVYAVIGYYLHHQAHVDAYLQEQQIIATQVRQQNEVRFNPTDVRARLVARRLSRG